MLPALIVFILVAAAIVTCFIKSQGIAKLLALVAHAITFAISIAILVITADGTHIMLTFGAEPWNFYVLVGFLDAFLVSLFTGISLLILWASVSMINHDIEAGRVRFYYALVNILTASLVGIVVFENFFSIFLMVEFSSFAAVGIIIIKNKKENMRAGLKYLTLSILGSSFILMGIINLYFLTDALSITLIAEALPDVLVGNEATLRSAFIFIAIGAALKSALFPLHIWLPDAHSTAPSPSSAILSALVIKSYMFLFVSLVHKVIGINIIRADEILSLTLNVVMFTGALAMIAGSVMAILQTDIKRMIAYSSVAQVGYIFVGIGMGTQFGLFAAMFHILAHAVTKSALFLCAGSIIERTDNRLIANMVGLGKQMPITLGMFTIGALSMVGIPLFVGFNSKWFFATGMIESGNYILLGVLLLSALLNGVYYLPVVMRGFFAKNETEEVLVKCERPIKHLAPIMVLTALVVAFAIFSGPLNDLIVAGIESIWRG